MSITPNPSITQNPLTIPNERIITPTPSITPTQSPTPTPSITPNASMTPKVNTAWMNTSEYLIIISIILLFSSILILSGMVYFEIEYIQNKNYYNLIIGIIVVLSLFTPYLIMNQLSNSDEELNRAINIIFTYYEDISMITIIQIILVLIYSLLKYNDRLHEQYLIFIAFFSFGILRMFLLFIKTDISIFNYKSLDETIIDSHIYDEIRNIDGLNKNYTCITPGPDLSPVPVAQGYPLSCKGSKVVMNSENTSNLSQASISTFRWLQIYYHGVILLTIIGMMISMFEFFYTYQKFTCKSNLTAPKPVTTSNPVVSKPAAPIKAAPKPTAPIKAAPKPAAPKPVAPKPAASRP